jgi:hypothetical protein
MQITSEINVEALAEQVVAWGFEAAENLIIAIDDSAQDYEFTLNVAKKLVKALKACSVEDDPFDINSLLED